MNVVEELLAQRDAVLFGKWVKRPPQAENEACLVMRAKPGAELMRGGCTCGCEDRLLYVESDELSESAKVWARMSVEKLHGLYSAEGWNDYAAKSKDQVIEVLDEAIRMAKEAGL